MSLLLPIPGTALGQSAASSQTSVDAIDDEDMDEIIVTGRRNFNALVREGERLTEDFYMRLNDVLGNDDFRITCDNERRTGSNFVVQVCRTGFQRRLARYEAQAIVQDMTRLQDQAAMREVTGEPGGGETLPFGNTFGAEALRWQVEFEAAILAAVNTDPLLNQQVNRLLELKSAIENYRSGGDQQ